MTASFLLAAIGAALAFASGGLRDWVDGSTFRWPFDVALVLAWAFLVFGLGGMLVGILLNLFALFRRGR
jgi:hypothetical protein